MANFKRNTRYTNGTIDKNRSNQSFLILRQPLNLSTDSSGDTYVSITQDLISRPDIIADKVYGIPELWWAIYEYNNIADPLFDLQIGQVIKIPALNRVLSAISQIGKV